MMLALRLPPEIEDRLEALAKQTGRSKSFYARQAILEHLDDLEDIYLAESRMKQLAEGKSSTVSIAELVAKYELED